MQMADFDMQLKRAKCPAKVAEMVFRQHQAVHIDASFPKETCI